MTAARVVNYTAIVFAVLGAIVGASALYFQYRVYGMEAPNATWLWKVPFLTVGYGIIAGGLVVFFFAMLEGLLELIDPNEHWPHV